MTAAELAIIIAACIMTAVVIITSGLRWVDRRAFRRYWGQV